MSNSEDLSKKWVNIVQTDDCNSFDGKDVRYFFLIFFYEQHIKR